MKAYELMVIIDPALEDEPRAAALEKVQGLVTAPGGTVDSVDEWGKRKLAFEIGGKTEGDYTVIQFHGTPEIVAEMDRVLHITDFVVRYMLLRREDLE
ncbi:MAG: 30S ribosomal protein S6 [Actinobacteria bacterium]|nr:MAG: 30S ribosomal protein S6 [Actinomycetota bacterium]